MKTLLSRGLTFTQVDIGLQIDEVTNNKERKSTETARALLAHVAKVCKHNLLEEDEILKVMRDTLKERVSDKDSFSSSASLAVLSFDLAYLNGFDLKGYQLTIAHNFEEFVKTNYPRKLPN